MKTNKIIILVFSQIILISALFLASSVALSSQSQLLNNIDLYKSDPNSNLISSANPNLLDKWKLDYTPEDIDISANGRYFVSVEQDFCNLTLFDRNGPRWKYDLGSTASFYSVAISADGQYIVSGDEKNNITLFNQAGFLDNYTLGNEVRAVAISQDGSYFVAGDYNGYITLFNRSNPNPDEINFMWSYDTGGAVNTVDISADGQFIAAGDNDGNVTYISKDGTIKWEHHPGTGYVRSVAMSSYGSYIVSGQLSSYNITLFNSTGYVWNYTAGNNVYSVDISQDGRYIVAGGYDDNVTLFGQNGTKIWEYDTGNNIRDVAISADGQFIVAGDINDNITLFNRAGFMWNYTAGANALGVAISADGEYFVAITEADYNVYLFYNPLTSQPSKPNPLLLLLGMQQPGAGDLLIILFLIIGIGAAAVVIFMVLKKRE